MLRLFWALARALSGLWVWFRNLPREAAVALGTPTAGRSARPGRLWKAFAITLPIALLAAIFVPQIILVMSPSIEAWAVRKAPGPIKRGDYVMFMLHHPVAGPKPVSVTKHALCLPGDRLTMTETPSKSPQGGSDARYFCNGELLGVTLPRAHNGMKLEHMKWNGVVPPGMAYVGSSSPRGFDSRYYGLVALSRLTRMKRIF